MNTEITTPKCPDCGERMYVPSWIKHLNKWYCPKERKLIDPEKAVWGKSKR
jgi:ribosomal protein L33